MSTEEAPKPPQPPPMPPAYNKSNNTQPTIPRPPSTTATPERRCVHCKATTTPLWRRSPLGPKTLCNACGVRMKKGRLAYMDGRFIAIESAAAQAKRRKAEAAARSARDTSVQTLATSSRTISKTKPNRPRRPRASTTSVPTSSRRTRPFPAAASGLYYLLAAIDFVETS